MTEAEVKVIEAKKARRFKLPRGWTLLAIAVLGWVIVGITGYILFLSGIGWMAILDRLGL